MSEELVRLRCVKEGSRLRVKIISSGYNNFANCQFPRDIRQVNREYMVPVHAISFSEGAGRKFFYRVSKSYIKIAEDTYGDTYVPGVGTGPIELKIFGDDDSTECIICMSEEKDVVFSTCGHYACCGTCAGTIFRTTKKCPICRGHINCIVKRENCG
jgi:hypothetical protein